jgi:undecaprenyl diphosphate synthase
LSQKIPQHVAIIMDGNGRWAEQRGLSRAEGHRLGVEVVRVIVEASLTQHVETLSLFAFGQENWARPADEVNFLMTLFVQSLDAELTKLHEQGVRLTFIGDRTGLDDVLQTMMQAAEDHTRANQKLTLNIVVNYSGRWDIVDATRRLMHRVQAGEIAPDDVNEAIFSETLVTHALPDPDLFIRTSGERRISNFFLWQLAYSELYFTDILWPDFTSHDFKQALDWFASRERRYGKTSHQLENQTTAIRDDA